MNALIIHKEKKEGFEEKSLEITTEYYEKLKNFKPSLKYDPIEVAKAEVNWWSIHDQYSEELAKNPAASSHNLILAVKDYINALVPMEKTHRKIS